MFLLLILFRPFSFFRLQPFRQFKEFAIKCIFIIVDHFYQGVNLQLELFSRMGCSSLIYETLGYSTSLMTGFVSTSSWSDPSIVSTEISTLMPPL